MITTAIAAAVVVIELKALVGLSATQIADYAAMRTLVGQSPDHLAELKAASILGAMDAPFGSETPLSLTRWNFAYLKARYEGDPRVYGPRMLTAMHNAIRLSAGQAEATPNATRAN